MSASIAQIWNIVASRPKFVFSPTFQYIRHMRSHNSGNIQGENLHIWAVERKKLFLEN